MKKAILATKVGMTQIFQEDGSLIPVTVLQAGPCGNSGKDNGRRLQRRAGGLSLTRRKRSSTKTRAARRK